MSLDAHISELRRKHEALDARIARETQSPGTDDLTIAALKREKLHLKEQITRLSPAIE